VIFIHSGFPKTADNLSH